MRPEGASPGRHREDPPGVLLAHRAFGMNLLHCLPQTTPKSPPELGRTRKRPWMVPRTTSPPGFCPNFKGSVCDIPVGRARPHAVFP